MVPLPPLITDIELSTGVPVEGSTNTDDSTPPGALKIINNSNKQISKKVLYTEKWGVKYGSRIGGVSDAKIIKRLCKTIILRGGGGHTKKTFPGERGRIFSGTLACGKLFAAIVITMYFDLSVTKPLTPRSDRYVNSPYNFNTLSSRQVMKMKKIIN